MAAAPPSRPEEAYRHLVFDLDGTLVDTKDDLAAAVNVALSALGLPPQAPRTLWGYVGNGARVLLERALGPDRGHLLEPALEVFMPWYQAHLLDHARVYPGMPEVLAELTGRGVGLSVLTNKPFAMSMAVLEGLGLAPHLPRVIGGDSLPVKKPDPTGLRTLIDESRVPAAATLMVGDSAIDVATGRAAGVATCGVLWGFNGEDVSASAPDLVVATPAALASLAVR